MNEKLKVVVAGCGWGQHHMRAVAESEDAELAAIWSRKETNERLELAASYNVPFYSDFEKMLKEVKPNAATIATPEATHSQLSIKALESGAHVYCEKVLASSSREADEMLKAAELGVRFSVIVSDFWLPVGTIAELGIANATLDEQR